MGNLDARMKVLERQARSGLLDSVRGRLPEQAGGAARQGPPGRGRGPRRLRPRPAESLRTSFVRDSAA